MKTKLQILSFLCILFCAGVLNAQWSSNPQVNSVICDVQQRQTLPKIVPTSDNVCFISWFDTRGNGRYKVFLQRLNSQGVKQFGTDGLLVSDNPQNSWIGDYDLEVDANDNAILVFSDIRNSLNDTVSNPFIYKISSTGQFLWGPNGVTLTNNFSAYQVWPKAAVLTDGSVIVVWWYINSSQRNSWITMRRVSAAGIPVFPNPINIQDPGGKRYQYPDVCAAENGNYILSWVYGPKDTTGSFIPDNISIFTHKYNSSGNPVWNANTTVYTNTGNHIPIYCVPRIYPDGSGGALYSFFTTEGNGLFSRAQRINAAGTALFPVNGSEGSTGTAFIHVEPYLAYMPSTNEAYMFWTDADAGTQSFQSIFGQRFSSTGARMWGENGMSFSTLDSVSIYGIRCFTKDTSIIVTYGVEPIGPPSTTIKGFRLNREGFFVWPGNQITLSSISSAKGFIEAAMVPSGVTIVAWEDNRNAPFTMSGGIYAQNLGYNGTIGPVGISQTSELMPESYSLHQNYPNPFNNSTVIEFEIKNNGIYKVEVFDMTGKKVDELLNSYKTAGSYKINYNADKLSSGVYLYKLSSSEINLTRKFILIK